jgi:drug/metabolite transporter (DMT)-like permease
VRVWTLGIYGLFGYHFFYFLAIKNAPPVEANLINYLWPLLIVVFSAFLPGERLRWFHLTGAAAGFLGAALLVTRGQSFQLDPAYSLGYAAAVGAALLWSSYSVLSRLFGSIPTDSVGGFCGATALLSAGCHFLFEQSVWPTGIEWLAILCLGLGPVGSAFFTWDHGVKHGNIKMLGAFAYAAPLLSTILLIVFGLAEPSWTVAVACLFIIGGAVLAAGDFFKRQ